jgi:hypothetical protein
MLRLAAALTVDETKKAFAKWKAFSLSAVPSSSDYSEVPAITLAPGIDDLLQPLPDQSLARLHADASGDRHLQVGHAHGRVDRLGNPALCSASKNGSGMGEVSPGAVTTSSSTSRPIQNTIERGNRERG